MAQSVLRFIRRSAEYLELKEIPQMSAGTNFAIKGRLRAHVRSKRKKKKWTHFSVFQVWDNVTDQEIAELEGFARHIYQYDQIASRLNIRRGYKKLGRHGGVRNDKISTWN